MDFIQVSNVRSLASTPPVPISPITLLLGTNSSGKSTFLRLIPLIKQSSESRSREPILWLGRLVDFGSFGEAITRYSSANALNLRFTFWVPAYVLRGRTFALHSEEKQDELEKIDLSIAANGAALSERPSTVEVHVAFENHTLELHVNAEQEVSKLLINGFNYSDMAASALRVREWHAMLPAITWEFDESITKHTFGTELLDFVRHRTHGNTSVDRVAEIVESFATAPLPSLLARTQRSPAADATWSSRARDWTDNTSEFQKLRSLVLGYQLQRVFSGLEAYLTLQGANIRYITPLRASAERYYRNQGVAVEEVDSQGQNTAMYLHNLTRHERQNFAAWMHKFFGVTIGTHAISGHVSLELRETSQVAEGFNLADTGFGYSQMLPILVQLWAVTQPSPRKQPRMPLRTPHIFAIEQPELHLHPRLQAQLADVLIAALSAARERNIDLRLLIETHSEHLVNRFGLRVAQGKINADSVGIALFEKASFSEPTTVRTTKFASSGFIESWPYGFFEPRESPNS